MESPPAASYLRTYRKKSGLSQRELAEVLGLISEWRISEHERSITVPRFLTAISYEIIFNVPISKLFPGIYETVRENVESRLSEFETQLQESDARGRAAIPIARKLEWIHERRNLADDEPSL
jgi:transcriptional regulator with XRE-family HTH domain